MNITKIKYWRLTKICRESSSSPKIGQKSEALYLKYAAFYLKKYEAFYFKKYEAFYLKYGAFYKKIWGSLFKNMRLFI
jgi:hypothetical protein